MKKISFGLLCIMSSFIAIGQVQLESGFTVPTAVPCREGVVTVTDTAFTDSIRASVDSIQYISTYGTGGHLVKVSYNNSDPDDKHGNWSLLSPGDVMMVAMSHDWIQCGGRKDTFDKDLSKTHYGPRHFFGVITGFDPGPGYVYLRVSIDVRQTRFFNPWPGYRWVGLPTQIVKVPIYEKLILEEGAVVTCHPWDGKTGGICAFYACDSLIFRGDTVCKIDVTAKGLRGGVRDNDTAGFATPSGSIGAKGKISDKAGKDAKPADLVIQWPLFDVPTVKVANPPNTTVKGAKGGYGTAMFLADTALNRYDERFKPRAGLPSGEKDGEKTCRIPRLSTSLQFPRYYYLTMGSGGSSGLAGKRGASAGGHGGGGAYGPGGNEEDGDIGSPGTGGSGYGGAGGTGGGLIAVWAENISMEGNNAIVHFQANGGDAENGSHGPGKGGDGGNGGRGGDGLCTGVDYEAPGQGGGAGQGGKGSSGGNGGNAGLAGNILIFVTNISPSVNSINTETQSGKYGKGGNGGISGSNGRAGFNGQYNYGTCPIQWSVRDTLIDSCDCDEAFKILATMDDHNGKNFFQSGKPEPLNVFGDVTYRSFYSKGDNILFSQRIVVDTVGVPNGGTPIDQYRTVTNFKCGLSDSGSFAPDTIMARLALNAGSGSAIGSVQATFVDFYPEGVFRFTDDYFEGTFPKPSTVGRGCKHVPDIDGIGRRHGFGVPNGDEGKRGKVLGDEQGQHNDYDSTGYSNRNVHITFASGLMVLSNPKNEAINLNVLTVYPNPSNNGTFILHTKSTEAMQVEVYNTDGKLLLSTLLIANADNKFVLNTELNSGIYLLKSTQGDSVYVKSIGIE